MRSLHVPVGVAQAFGDIDGFSMGLVENGGVSAISGSDFEFRVRRSGSGYEVYTPSPTDPSLCYLRFCFGFTPPTGWHWPSGTLRLSLKAGARGSPVQIDAERLIDWLRQLIRIPSITGNEEAISRYVAHEAGKLGYEPQVEENNVFFEAGSGGKSLLLNSHLDTVDLGGQWKHDPFGAALEEGKIFGRGSSDDKGNIAAMLEIARLARGKQLNGRLLFTFTTGEEFGTALEAKGSFILAKHLKADRALVLEPQFDSDAKRVNIITDAAELRT